MNKIFAYWKKFYILSLLDLSTYYGKSYFFKTWLMYLRLLASFSYVTARSYFLPILLSILYIIYNIYYGTVYLCDDGDSLSQLKLDLTLEVGRYRISVVNYEMYMDIKNQIINSTSSNSDLSYLTTKLNNALGEMRDSLNNARLIETNIRRLEPDFRSPITSINYLRVYR